MWVAGCEWACGGLWVAQLGGVGMVTALPTLVIQMSPEVNDRAVHVVTAAQGYRAATVRADGLRQGVFGGGDGLVGGFRGYGFFCTTMFQVCRNGSNIKANGFCFW